jgi:prolyl-tRNA synthetase
LALLRGDHPLNDAKIASAVGAALRAEGAELTQLRPAHPEEIYEAMGAHAGSLGAVGVTRHKIFVDNGLQGRANMTTGANVDDHHLRGVNIDRDIKKAQWVDLRTVAEGEGCPKCDGMLRHIFKLGVKYSVSMGATVLNSDGKEVPIVMGSYGIGVERILAAAIELRHDEAGAIFPMTIAPFQVVVSPLNIKDAELKATADRIYEELNRAGVDVLYDDRDERAGVKLNDADLVGFPFQLRIGPKKLKEGKVEFYDRATRTAEDVTVSDAVRITKDRVDEAMRKLNER